MKLTKEQRVALKRVYDRDPSVAPSYLQFRRQAVPAIGIDCVMIHWKSMWLGIETDGYVHS